jgi:4-amino-4-deoxy-L-arabinose transferase-like glycosyltransferase
VSTGQRSRADVKQVAWFKQAASSFTSAASGRVGATLRWLRCGWRRIPRAGRICFMVAFVNLAIWSVVVPPFQVPDETAHFAYAQYLAESGQPPPQGPGAQYSAQEQVALDNLNFIYVIGHPAARGVLTPAENRQVRGVLALHPSPLGDGAATPSTNQPPLYYALEAIPYWLSPSHDLFARLALMRLLSALLGALTVLCVYLFLRELLPATPWVWTTGALAVAFQPMFAFISAGVQGDNLLFFASAATFLALLRAWRRGLTVSRGAAIGAATAVGVLGKLTFSALVPGIALALALLTWRALPQGRRQALRAAAVAVVIVVAPAALYALLNAAVWHRGGPTAGGFAAVGSSASPSGPVTMHQSLDYIWQLYLPRLWFMHHLYFPGGYPLWTIWLNGSIGAFGWLDYGFPVWVYADGRWVLYALAAFFAVGALRLGWARVRSVLPLFFAFAVSAVGLLSAIGWDGLRYRLQTGYQFEQARYLFPLLCFYGVFIALVVRAVPRRWQPVAGALLVVLAMAHGLFAETLTISRYYG